MARVKLDRIVVAVVAVAPPLLGLAITHHLLSGGDATAVGAVLTALLGGYLTPSDEARAALSTVKSITPGDPLGPLPGGSTSTL
jgi:hypothetical protein